MNNTSNVNFFNLKKLSIVIFQLAQFLFLYNSQVQEFSYTKFGIHICVRSGFVEKIDTFFVCAKAISQFYPQSAFSTSDIYSAVRRRPSARRFVSPSGTFLFFCLNNVARNDFQFVIRQVTQKIYLHDDDVHHLQVYII